MAFFGIFLPTCTTFVCQNDSVQQTKKWLSHWLSAKNKTNLCCSDSVQQTILNNYPISLWHVTKELGKTILSNLNFTTAIKLLWDTFFVIVNFLKKICIIGSETLHLLVWSCLYKQKAWKKYLFVVEHAQIKKVWRSNWTLH